MSQDLTEGFVCSNLSDDLSGLSFKEIKLSEMSESFVKINILKHFKFSSNPTRPNMTPNLKNDPFKFKICTYIIYDSTFRIYV